eukprot:TRINITY_DN2009_c0_g1_i1.p1 TRINITY_DN2009_c0_g1~~TRINITY_DN2009_c0_g1_i1.p1  ORF type:complete len:1254 (+),score=225.55 TRINITY_DN2009_c0_g1_i1:54-3815(+)
MHFIRWIEIENFKSYYGNHRIGPFKNFTSIIGPNGSGKSNIMDAISFVLGIRSKEIRSEANLDLIHFNSTKNRKPTFCKVVLCLVESETNEELFFSRLLNENGSRYKINEKTVTSSHYHKELNNIGIIIKARNFLVFQGDIMTVVSQDSRKITNLFEIISGSIEYKREYNKLSQQNSIVEEEMRESLKYRKDFEDTKNTYEEQKNIAKKFDRLKEQRDELRSKELLSRCIFYDGKLTEAESASKKYHENVDILVDELKRVDSLFDEVNRKRADLVLNYKKTANSRQNAQREFEQINLKYTELKKKELFYSKDKQFAQQKYDTMKSGIEQDTKEADEFRAAVTDLEEKLEALDLWYEEQQKKHQHQFLQEGEEPEFKQLLQLCEEKTMLLETEYETLTNLISADARQIQNYHNEMKSAQERTKQTENQLIILERMISEEEAMINKYEIELSELRVRQRSLLDEFVQIEKKESLIKADINHLNSRMNELTANRHDLEKIKHKMGIINDLKRHIPGVLGRVTDLCSPIASRYNLAIAVAMGRHTDSIVVEDTKVAKACIEYLRNKKAKPLTFLPMDLIKPKDKQKTNLTERLTQSFSQSFSQSFTTTETNLRDVIPVLDCIHYDSNLVQIFQHVFGSTMVCNTLEQAKFITYHPDNGPLSSILQGKRIKTVTLDGTLLRTSGIVSTGRGGLEKKVQQFSEQQISEIAREIEEKNILLVDLLSEKKKIPNRTELSSQILSLESKIETLRGDLIVDQRRLVEKKESLETCTNLERKLENRLNEHQTQSDSRVTQLSSVKNGLKEVKIKIFKKYKRRKGFNDFLDQLDNEADILKRYNEEKTQQIILKNNLIEKLEQIEYRLKNRNIKRIEKQLKYFDKELDDCRSELNSMEAKIKKIKNRLNNSKKVNDEHSNDLKDIEIELDRVIVSKKDLSKKLSFERENLQKQQIETQLYQNKVNHHIEQAIKENISLMFENGQNLLDLDADFNFDYLKLLDTSLLTSNEMGKLLDANLKGFEKIIVGYEDKINDLTQEMYENTPMFRLSDKQKEIQEQFGKAQEEAKNKREEHKMISTKFKEISKKRKDAFMKLFHHVQKVIDSIYKELTISEIHPQGGQAFINLENETLPFDGGVRFDAIPPLKRFRGMEGLSGGEKTIAALALLFSLHSFAPSPFFILDEVDAALDNTNLFKLTNFLQKQRDRLIGKLDPHPSIPLFQIIVISLKDVFFDKAENLIGVYKDQESQSSGVIQFDLEDFEEEED